MLSALDNFITCPSCSGELVATSCWQSLCTRCVVLICKRQRPIFVMTYRRNNNPESFIDKLELHHVDSCDCDFVIESTLWPINRISATPVS